MFARHLEPKDYLSSGLHRLLAVYQSSALRISACGYCGCGWRDCNRIKLPVFSQKGDKLYGLVLLFYSSLPPQSAVSTSTQGGQGEYSLTLIQLLSGVNRANVLIANNTTRAKRGLREHKNGSKWQIVTGFLIISFSRI